MNYVRYPDASIVALPSSLVVGRPGPPGPAGAPGLPGVIVATVYAVSLAAGYHNNGGAADTFVFIFGGPQVIDGHTLAVGDTVLISRGTIIANGLYVVTDDSSVSGSVIMTRDPRMITNDQIQNTVIYIGPAGTSYKHSSWMCGTNATITVGTTAYIFKQIGSPFELTVSIPNPTVGIYTLRAFAGRPGAWTDVKLAQTATGTVAATLVQGGTLSSGILTGGYTVTNFPATINSTPQSAVLLSTLFGAGESTQLVISGVSGATGLTFTLLGNLT